MYYKKISQKKNFYTTKSKAAPTRRQQKDFVGNKKAQIGETMTWMVGTIVVIVILAIAIFIVQTNFSKKEFTPFLSTDLLVTKSVVGFLKQGNNFELIKKSIEDNDYEQLKPKVDDFLKSISTGQEWDFRVFVNDELIKDFVISNNFHGLARNRFSYFEFNLNNKKINIKLHEGGGK